MRVRVGLARAAFYGEALANRGWLGLMDTLEAVKPQLQALVQQGGGEIRRGG